MFWPSVLLLLLLLFLNKVLPQGITDKIVVYSYKLILENVIVAARNVLGVSSFLEDVLIMLEFGQNRSGICLFRNHQLEYE